MLLSGTITITGAGGDHARKEFDEKNKAVILRNCAPFSNCISQIENTQIDNAKYLDAVMAMYNLIAYSNTYSKISGSLWQYYRDDPNDNIALSEA